MKKSIILLISLMVATIATSLQAQTKSGSRTTSAPVKTSSSTTSPGAPVARTVPSSTYRAPVNRPITSGSARESHLRVGLRLGVNSTTISGFDFSSVGTGLQAARVTGFHGGVVVNSGGPSFSVQPELLFSQYGTRVKAGSDYLQLKYNLLELPVMLKATFGQSDLRFFVNAGPVVSYTMGGTIMFQESGQSGSQAIDMTGSGRLSYGAAGGSGIVLKAGPGSLMMEARYTYLFSSNENKDKLNPQNLMGSIGYLIPLRSH